MVVVVGVVITIAFAVVIIFVGVITTTCVVIAVVVDVIVDVIVDVVAVVCIVRVVVIVFVDAAPTVVVVYVVIVLGCVVTGTVWVVGVVWVVVGAVWVVVGAACVVVVVVWVVAACVVVVYVVTVAASSLHTVPSIDSPSEHPGIGVVVTVSETVLPSTSTTQERQQDDDRSRMKTPAISNTIKALVAHFRTELSSMPTSCPSESSWVSNEKAPTASSLPPLKSHMPHGSNFHSFYPLSGPGHPQGDHIPYARTLPRPLIHNQNPHHIPLPTPSDNNLTHGAVITEAISRSPVVKVAEYHHPKSCKTLVQPSNSQGKAKCKQVEISGNSSSTNTEDSDSPPKKQSTHGGRRTGAGNYQEQEIQALLKYTQKLLPIGQWGWKKLIKTKKPTEDEKHPQSVTHAKAIDKMINERAGTWNVNDSEFEDDEARRGVLSSVEETHKSKPKIHTAIASYDRSEAPQAHRPCGSQTTELIGKIMQALDPEAQRAHDEECANRFFQTTQAFTLSTNLRNAHARIKTLHSKLNSTRDRLHKVEHIHDQALHSPTSQKNHKYLPDLIRVCGKVRHDKYFPEGGQRTTWITDGSSASDWDDGRKENFNPSTKNYHHFSSESTTPSDYHHFSSKPTTPSIKPQHRNPSQSESTTPSVKPQCQKYMSTSFMSPVPAFPILG
ncbi:hypothetical protein BYT27DRAFT_7263598 [Phlegmacium glaucopus]|nr:hypothetical protein BYT27DRAFT_7263598 [Phlegmacium glaucopus]